MTQSKPLDRQYQVAIEVVLDDAAALASFVDSPGWTDTVDGMAEHCEAVHAPRVTRCITTKIRGEITLAGVRGVAVADVIGRLQARSQTDDAVSRLFLPEPVGAGSAD